MKETAPREDGGSAIKANGSATRRRHGYRGYGSGVSRGTDGYGGAVHWGRGFGGVGSAGVSGKTGLLKPELVSR
jgi:hypothetical protein